MIRADLAAALDQSKYNLFCSSAMFPTSRLLPRLLAYSANERFIKPYGLAFSA
jgi:hypothetical protein